MPGIKKRGIELKKCGIFRKLYSCRELTNVCPPEKNGFFFRFRSRFASFGPENFSLAGNEKPGIELKK